MTEVFVQEHLLECGICLDMLNETCKMLPCQHTYCKTCLENTRRNEGCLRCPQCRTVIDIDINDLPKNLVLLSLIEQVKKKPLPPPSKRLLKFLTHETIVARIYRISFIF